jgi:alginate O-acetyltransferase complex protein AlgI
VFLPAAARWRNPTLAVLATMVAIGLWHEFTARYLLWGLYHGAGIAVHRVFAARAGPLLARSPSRTLRAAGTIGATALTFTFVIVGFAITKNTSLAGTAEDFGILLFGDAP